jgi:glutamate--cysteine ligase
MLSRSPLLEGGLVSGLTEADLAAELRENAFRPGPAPRRIGAEIELLPVVAATHRMAPVAADPAPSTLPILRRCAAEHGWSEGSRGGAPTFLTPDGTLVSYEPGGQIELSSPPCATIAELASGLRRISAQIADAARPAGILLLSMGMHPTASVDDVPLQLGSERYRRMDRYFRRIGPAGARMMRLTCACQVNLDWGAEPERAVRVLNAAAPLLVAIFANSPRRAGAVAPAQSQRSLTWQALDPGRTGVLTGDPVESYLRFALAAGSVLLGEEEDEPLPFRSWVERGVATIDDWHAHLSTLFPEVRPKGYAEVRSLDAVPGEWLEAPLVLLAGLLEPAALREAEALLPGADAAALARAAQVGLGDAQMLRRARELWGVALASAAAGSGGLVDDASLEVAREFAARFTDRGLSPGDSPGQ